MLLPFLLLSLLLLLLTASQARGCIFFKNKPPLFLEESLTDDAADELHEGASGQALSLGEARDGAIVDWGFVQVANQGSYAHIADQSGGVKVPLILGCEGCIQITPDLIRAFRRFGGARVESTDTIQVDTRGGS